MHDAATFAEWLRMYVATQLTHTDALLMRLLYEGVDESHLADLACAATLPAQVRTADIAMAKRIRTIGADALGVPARGTELAHPALEFAYVARHFGVPLEDAMTAHLTGAASTLTQNAVRGIPIGQSDGQRIITAAHEWVARACADVHLLEEEDLGVVAPGLEIAQMQHERLRARMFMS
ncbi:MAG TPA: urease accessory UreF family protein [Actinomycetaceae bacterium]|nr:urease accessory UreF family protein [Actinomycetaceae bacterium]